MPTVLIFHTGDWAAEQVVTDWQASSWEGSPAVESAIDAAWASALSVPGRQLFDGPMCRLESLSATSDRLQLGMSRTSYRVFWGTQLADASRHLSLRPAERANPVGVSTALETADGWLLLGRRSERVAYYPGWIHPFAGTLDPADLLPQQLTDPAGADRSAPAPHPMVTAYRELREELLLQQQEIAVARVVGVVSDPRLQQPEVIVRVRVQVTRSDLVRRLDPEEHDSVVAVPTDGGALLDWLGSQDAEARRTPVAVGALVCWGQSVHGKTWGRTAFETAGAVTTDNGF